MIDPKHLYTLHNTYTGFGCAICGHDATNHPTEAWFHNGNKVEPETLIPIIEEKK